jgi:hypothetical protein
MKRKMIVLLLLLTLLIGGCGVMDNESETIDLHGKTAWTADNSYIYAPQNYFTNGYKWVAYDTAHYYNDR